MVLRKLTFAFHVISHHRDKAGNWKFSLWKSGTNFPWQLNANGLATAEDRSPGHHDMDWTFKNCLRDLVIRVFTWYSSHYCDAIMGTVASQITSLTIVYTTVYSDPDQSKHQSSASLAFVWGIHRDRWIPRTKVQLRGKCFHLMTSSCSLVMAMKCINNPPVTSYRGWIDIMPN